MTLGKVWGAGGGVRAQGGGSGRCRGPTRPQPKPPACMARTPHAPSRSRAAVAGAAMVVSAAQLRTQTVRAPGVLTAQTAGDQSFPRRGGTSPGAANHGREKAGRVWFAANPEQEAGLFAANPEQGLLGQRIGKQEWRTLQASPLRGRVRSH